MPMLTVASVDASRDFYVDKLGFGHMMGVVGRDGSLDFTIVDKDGAKVMLTRSETPQPPAPSAQLYIQVSGVEAYHKLVAANGVEATPPEDMWWGDRMFIVTNNDGYKLWFYETVGSPQPPAGVKVI